MQILLKNAYDKSANILYSLRVCNVVYNPEHMVYIRQHFQNVFRKIGTAIGKGVHFQKKGNVTYEVRDESGKLLGNYHARDIKT